MLKFQFVKKCGAGVVLIALSFASKAQSTSEIQQAVQDALRQQQLQVQRQQEQLLKERQSTVSPAQIEVQEPAPVAAVAGACREVQVIEVEGVKHLPSRAIEQITAAYAAKCLGVSEIENILSELTRAYVQRGWISARAYLPEQDLSQGHLKILVVEGQLASIRLEDNGAQSISIATAAPGLVGEPLNIRDLEQALDQINRLSSNHATLDMLPGKDAGDTVVVLRNQPSRRLRLLASFDNHGSESTGQSCIDPVKSCTGPKLDERT